METVRAEYYHGNSPSTNKIKCQIFNRPYKFNDKKKSNIDHFPADPENC